MSCKSRICFTTAIPLYLLLSACGGGGGGAQVASIPAPPVTPTPKPTYTPPRGTAVFPAPVSAAAPGSTVDLTGGWVDSPATRNGVYDLIGRLTLGSGSEGPTSYRAVALGEFTMNTDWYFGRASGDLPNYTITSPNSVFPAGLKTLTVTGPYVSWTINLPPSSSFYYPDIPFGESTIQMLGEQLNAFSKAPDGTETQFLSYNLTRGSSLSTQPLGDGKALSATLDYDIGNSYVAMGEWSWITVDLNGKPAGDYGALLFVDGDRTPASGIPVSGTATYDARSLSLKSSSTTVGIPFTLTADFGQRTIATRIDQNYQYDSGIGSADPMGDLPIEGIHVGGSAPFSNDGTFDIPLTGTVNYDSADYDVTPAAQAATGDMNGAFFGPKAEQVGGTFSLQISGSTVEMQDAFVGQQRH